MGHHAVTKCRVKQPEWTRYVCQDFFELLCKRPRVWPLGDDGEVSEMRKEASTRVCKCSMGSQDCTEETKQLGYLVESREDWNLVRRLRERACGREKIVVDAEGVWQVEICVTEM